MAALVFIYESEAKTNLTRPRDAPRKVGDSVCHTPRGRGWITTI